MAKEDKNKVQIQLMPYAGITQYTLPSGIFVGYFHTPQLSYLAGINLAISFRRLMSAISGIADFSFSQLNVTDGSYSYSGTFFTPQLGLRYTYPKGNVRPYAGLGADITPKWQWDILF